MAYTTNGWDYIYNINLESLNKLIPKQTVEFKKIIVQSEVKHLCLGSR